MHRHPSLLDFICKKAFRRGEFVLASGAKSDFYLDCRQVLLHPFGVRLAVEALFKTLGDQRLSLERDIDAVGGVPMGAAPWLGAFLYASFYLKPDLAGFLARKESKTHGVGGRIAGTLRRGDRCLMLEDVTTTGESLAEACRAVVEAGGRVVGAICLVDRQEGATARLAAMDVTLVPIVTVQDLLAAECESTKALL